MDDVNHLVEDNARDDFACTFSQELEHFHIHQGFTGQAKSDDEEGGAKSQDSDEIIAMIS